MKTVFALLLFIPLLSSAQKVAVTFNAGLGTYNMSDLKQLQQKLSDEFPVEGQTTSSFPSFWYYDGATTITINEKLITGVHLSYTSTGSRTSYNDYSGGVRLDQLVSGYSVATIIGWQFNFPEKGLEVDCTLIPGATHTELTIKRRLVLNNSGSEEEKYQAGNVNIFFQPNISVTKRFWYVGANVSVGYYKTFLYGEMTAEDSSTDLILYNKNDPYYPDWSGLRVSAGIRLYFSKVPKSVRELREE